MQTIGQEEKHGMPPFPLTGREKDVADLLAIGLEQTAIAHKLSYTPAYIHEVVRRIRAKYCAETTYQLIGMLVIERLPKPM